MLGVRRLPSWALFGLVALIVPGCASIFVLSLVAYESGPPAAGSPSDVADRFLTALDAHNVVQVVTLSCPDPGASASAESFIGRGLPGKFTQVPGWVSYPSGEIDLLYKFQVSASAPKIKATVNLLPSATGYCVTAVVLNAIFRG